MTYIKNEGELGYLELMRDILENGEKSDDRTGVGTTKVFGRMLRFDLKEGFPLFTTKKMRWRSVVSELLWFIEGSSDERRLAEIRYGKDRSELDGKTTIWTENAEAPYWVPKARFPGDLGAIYGVAWRSWPDVTGSGTIDQLANLISGIKKDPNGRRHILNAWNPAVLDNCALPPCHVMSQYTVNSKGLSCLMSQRSADGLLGIPYNVASYALLTHMIAQVCDLEVNELIISFGDCHIYNNAIDVVRTQLERTPYDPPYLLLDKSIKDIDDFRVEHCLLMDYEHQGELTAKMAV